MTSVAGNDSEFVHIAGEPVPLHYSMASLEKIEKQFGSLGEMQRQLTDGKGEIRMDRPVIGLLIDIIHAGLLERFPNTPEGRQAVAMGFEPGDMPKMVAAMTRAFGNSFGDMLGKASPDSLMQGYLGANGTTRQRSSSGARKRTGKT